MSHGILTDDLGVVWGTTWHEMPQYLQLERPPTIEEVRTALDMPIEKRRLYFKVTRDDGSSRGRRVAAHALYRPDTGRILVPAVGERYTVIQRVTMVDWIHEHLLKEYPDLVLESAGTLWGGRVAFINLVLEQFHIKGDGSENLNRLTYYDPLGEGPFRVCAHTVRIVCNNTLQMADHEAVRRGAMLRAKHTDNAGTAITKHLVDLAETRLACVKRREELEALALWKVKAKTVEEFTEAMFPTLTAPKDRKLTAEEVESLRRRNANVAARRGDVVAVFEQDPQHLDKVARTGYGLLSAFTYWSDHLKPARATTTDAGTRYWDGLTGQGASSKADAHTWLVGAMP